MPKTVDYAARFAFLREAAFTLVCEGGLRRLTRQAIADELGASVSTVRRLLDSSASLDALAASQVATRRRQLWLKTRGSDTLDLPVALAADLLPSDSWTVLTELAWWRLLIDATGPTGAVVTSADTPLSLRDQFQLAENLIVDDVPSPAREARTPDAAMRRHISEREEEVSEQLDRVLSLLGIPLDARDSERVCLRALIDGLTIRICLHGLAPEVARQAVSVHLDRLDRRGQDLGRAG